MIEPWQGPLWDAVNKVVTASGGKTSCLSVARQRAVVEVNGAVREAIRSAVEEERRRIVKAIRAT